MFSYSIIGLLLTASFTICGCGLLWFNSNGLSSTTLSARKVTAAIFDYIYLLGFAALAIIGKQVNMDGMVRVGLLGTAALVFLVHTESTVGHGWANANLYRKATDDAVKYPDNPDGSPTSFDLDEGGNRQLLAGTVLCLMASFFALISAIPTETEIQPVSKISLFTFIFAGIIIFALSVAWWSSDVCSIFEDSNLAEVILYNAALKIVASMILALVILGIGLFRDVQEYVVVATFVASQQFCYILSYGLRMIDVQRYSTHASDSGDMDTSRAGVALFYIASFLLMCSAAAYFAERSEREHHVNFLNRMFMLVAVLLIIPGAALLWHQCRGLGKDAFGARSANEFRSNVAEVFGYVYAVMAAIGVLLGVKLIEKPGMITFFIVVCASMLLTLSSTLGNFSWSNGNVFREADMSDITVDYGVEYLHKKTLNNGDSDRQVAGGFTLVQLAGFFSLLSMIRLPEHTRNVLALALSGAAIAIFVACGIFEAESTNNELDASNIGDIKFQFVVGGGYYLTMTMVCNFFFLAFFVLLGFILGVREFVSLSVIVVAMRGLQTLQVGFNIADYIEINNRTDGDKALAAGALGFISSLLVVAASIIYFNDNDQSK